MRKKIEHPKVIHDKKVRISAEKRTKWTTEGLKPVSSKPGYLSVTGTENETGSLNSFNSRNQDHISITG